MNLLSKLWDFINHRSKSKTSVRTPHIHEAMDLDEYDHPQYNQWAQSSTPIEISKFINSQYGLFQAGLSFDHKIEFLDIASKSGVHLKCKDFRYNVEDYKNYLYFLTQKILNLGYVKNLAEVRSIEVDGNIITKYKYFLKPSLYHSVDSHNYGGIILEYNLVNDESDYFCIAINKHMDQRKNELAPMEEFMEEIF